MKFKAEQLDKFCVWCPDGQVVVDECKKIINQTLLVARKFPVQPIAILLLDVNMPLK